MKDWMGITNVSLCSAKLWIGKQRMILGMTRASILGWRITKKVKNIIGQNRASPADDSFCHLLIHGQTLILIHLYLLIGLIIISIL